MNKQVTPQEAKMIEEQAFEASCKKARVSIRARSESLVCVHFYLIFAEFYFINWIANSYNIYHFIYALI